MSRVIVARYTDTTNPDDQRFLYGPSQPVSTVGFVSSDLKWVKKAKNLVRLDISCNYLNQVDLSPLENCKTLKYLDLSENAIEDIDLSPLVNCTKLQTLDLSYNRMKDVNLTPLVNIESLRFIYLHQNKMDTINIAPLYQLRKLEKIIIETRGVNKPTPVYETSIADKPPNLNDVLYAMVFETERPEWLQGTPNVKIIRLKAESYKKHVKKHGWASVRKHLEAAHPLLHPKKDFLAQQAILKDFGCPELAGYDGSVSDLIKLIPTTGSYEEGVIEFQTELIALLQEQIDSGGSTLFFDIDKLSTTPGSVLVPSIVTQRGKELSELLLYHHNGMVNLMPMWLTGFGFNILQAARYGRSEYVEKVPKILERFKSELGITIPIKKTTSRKKHTSLGKSPSKALLDYVLTVVPA